MISGKVVLTTLRRLSQEYNTYNNTSATKYVDTVTDSVSDYINQYKNLLDSNSTTLTPASDVTVNAVLTSVFLNTIIFILLMVAYEILRRNFPSIYGGKPKVPVELPTGFIPINWMITVFKISWHDVRKYGGLDAYLFLRYTRMCFRIVFVSGIWGMIILWPLFGLGGGQAVGWYHISMANLTQRANALWVPVLFMWAFSFYVYYVMRKEYKHFMYHRMEFLGKGDPSVIPQHHYSLLVENIPRELRSDTALRDYFDALFPGKVHSTSVVLKLRDLDIISTRRKRVLHRLEKAVAHYEATGVRPSHIVGRPRLMLCGIQSEPLSCRHCCFNDKFNEDDVPSRGSLVDSIKYYAKELKQMNIKFSILQGKMVNVAITGNMSVRATDYISKSMSSNVSYVELDPTTKAGKTEYTKTSVRDDEIQAIEGYGTLGHIDTEREKMKVEPLLSQQCHLGNNDTMRPLKPSQKFRPRRFGKEMQSLFPLDSSFQPIEKEQTENQEDKALNALAEGFGVDFVTDTLGDTYYSIGSYVHDVVESSMSSTGFVTFTDLSSATCAASAPLTHKAGCLILSVAPEPRDIEWKNAHLDYDGLKFRETVASVLIALGAILWSIPLTVIQAFATADAVARIPGAEWFLNLDGGKVKTFVNGYLPVVALLGLILLLPIIFEWVAKNYERRKTFSEVQNSILTRYFYYQIANIYVTVTAGSLWDSLADILDQPSSVLHILGQSLPTIVGYFISLLVTKILAGLPMILLRFGSLGRTIFLRSIFSEKKLTLRELESIYKPQHLLLGWEYPSLLLVIVISFTYACISPIILPVASIYFGLALIIYKKQVLYVYTPRYESGGESYPLVMQRTLIGLLCGQVTLTGYMVIRGGMYQPLVLSALPVITLCTMDNFYKEFCLPSKCLSLERARGIDRTYERSLLDSIEENERIDVNTVSTFSSDAYKQPILTEELESPRPYREGYSQELIEDESIFDMETTGRFVKMMQKANISS